MAPLPPVDIVAHAHDARNLVTPVEMVEHLGQQRVAAMHVTDDANGLGRGQRRGECGRGVFRIRPTKELAQKPDHVRTPRNPDSPRPMRSERACRPGDLASRSAIAKNAATASGQAVSISVKGLWVGEKGPRAGRDGKWRRGRDSDQTLSTP